MEHESFADPETADVMNALFVNVKVDREERPDLDGVYMDAVVAMTGRGGWPMTVFLTPEGEPFYGGTYFPPEPKMGMPAFTDLLRAVSKAYCDRPDELSDQASRVVDSLSKSSTVVADIEGLDREFLTSAVAAISSQFDQTYGGFGQEPKFPPAPSIEFLLRMHLQGSPLALEMATRTLDCMAAGGIYDHIGGGFHRYAVDRIWLVPHFEKMLYDNALLASSYLHAWQVTGTLRYREVVEETLDYLLRCMLLPGGGIASAEDADTNGEEGLTYVWNPNQLREVLSPDEFHAIERFYGVEPGGNFEGNSILYEVGIDDVDFHTLSAARLKLRESRDLREQPFKDDKVVVSWNGLALAALAEAGARLGRCDYIDAATCLAKFLAKETVTSEGKLFRTWRNGEAKGSAYLEDYANVAHGLLELHVATGEVAYLHESRRLVEVAIECFSDKENGGFFFTSHDSEQLIFRKKEIHDHPFPSGNSMMASVLLRLSRIFGDQELTRHALGSVGIARRLLEQAPSSVAFLLGALEFHLAAPQEIAIVGDMNDERTVELRRVALTRYAPNTVIAFSDGSDCSVPLLAGKGLINGSPAAYVCQNFSCNTPSLDPDSLKKALEAEVIQKF